MIQYSRDGRDQPRSRGVLDTRLRGRLLDRLAPCPSPSVCAIRRWQGDAPMTSPAIRPARPDEYNEIARVWMNSWVSTGLAEASEFLLANLRARVRHEIEQGWTLFVADDQGALAAMLALQLPKRY